MEAGKNVFLAPASTSTSYRPSLPNVCTLAHVIWPSERATTTISPFLKELVGEKLKSSDSRQPCGGHTHTHVDQVNASQLITQTLLVRGCLGVPLCNGQAATALICHVGSWCLVPSAQCLRVWYIEQHLRRQVTDNASNHLLTATEALVVLRRCRVGSQFFRQRPRGRDLSNIACRICPVLTRALAAKAVYQDVICCVTIVLNRKATPVSED